MKPVHVIAIVAVALIAGALAGYLVGSSSAPARAPVVLAPEVAETPEVAQPAPVSIAPPETPAETASHQPAQPVRPVEIRGGATLSAWLATLDSARPVPGTGRIHGRVTSVVGTPLPGVEITATAMAESDTFYVAPNAPLASRLEAQARAMHFREAGKQTAISDSDGRYEFRNLGNYRFTMHATGPGHTFQPYGDMERHSSARPDAEVNFRGQPSGDLEIDVRMPDGTQPLRAMVHHQRAGQGGESGRGWRADDRKVQLPPGTYKLWASSGEGNTLVSESIEVEAKADQPPQQFVLHLKAMGAIACRLKLVDGSTMHNSMSGRMRITLQPDPPAEAPGGPPQGNNLQHQNVWGGWSFEEAAFNRLEPGRYRLFLITGQEVLAWHDVDVATELVKVVLAMPEPVAADHIIVRVVYHDGKPVIGANLRADALSGGNSMRDGTVLPVLQRDGGQYWVTRLKPDSPALRGVTQWSYRLTGNAPEYGSFTHDLPSAAPAEVTVTLQQPASLTVHFPGAGTHPQASQIHVQLLHQHSPSSWNSVQGSGGGKLTESMTFKPLAPGAYRLRLTLSSAGVDHEIIWDNTLAELQFDVHAGANTQTLAVPMVYTLTLLIADPAALRTLQLTHSGSSARRHYSRQLITERTVVAGLAAGEWMISSGDASMRVNVQSDREVAFTPRPFDALLVSNIRAGGKIEAMGLRNGDKIVRVDGAAPDTARELQGLVNESYMKESTSWTVQRGGATLEVALNGVELRKLMTAPGEDRETIGMRSTLRD